MSSSKPTHLAPPDVGSHTPRRVMVRLQDRILLLDLVAAGELLASVASLTAEQQEIAQEVPRADQPSEEQLADLVALLARVAPSDSCEHGQPLSQDFTLAKPFRIRNVVVASPTTPIEAAGGELLLRLELGLAFGSGQHPTTQLFIEALLDSELAGSRVADVGAGSAILAILAARLGARSVTAVDLHWPAVRNAALNVVHNRLDAVVKVARGSVEQLRGTYDCIVANTWSSDAAWGMLAGLAPRLRPGGVLITRGSRALLHDSEFKAALTRLGLAWDRTYSREDWFAIRLRRHSRKGGRATGGR